jgi:hypothetical protein
MNEPAIFFTPEGVKDVKEAMKAFIDKEETVQDVWAIRAQVTGLANNAGEPRWPTMATSIRPSSGTVMFDTMEGKAICSICLSLGFIYII